MQPHQFWQRLEPAGTFDRASRHGFVDGYPVALPDGRELLLPLRVLPDHADHAVASLIINQASFAVEDALAAALTDLLTPHSPDVIVGVPTLGLPLANNVARRLGHDRMVALGTSRKFWYLDALSQPMSSITTRASKRIFVDPRMLPLLEGRRVAVVDDVISSGTSMVSVLALLRSIDINVVAVGCAMLQSDVWRPVIADAYDGNPPPIVAPVVSPFLLRTTLGTWVPEPTA